MPQLSIITPCYNLGEYLQECIDSVNALEVDWEHIIVDDCSTHAETRDIIAALQQEKNTRRKVYRNEKNLELAGTLNHGIGLSTGKYILVLSADDVLIPKRMKDYFDLLESHPEYDIVYGDAEMFGAESGIDKSAPFNLQQLFLSNFIHASAIYRRAVWEATGGYDTTMPFIAIEDWEFWIHAAKLAFRFYYTGVAAFKYRILDTSKNRTINKNKQKVNMMLEHLYKRHQGFTGAAELDNFILTRLKQNPAMFFVKWLLKAYFPNYFAKLCRSGKLRKFH